MLEIIIKNQIQLKNSPIELINVLIQDLKVPNPKFLEAKRLGYSIYQ
jgi:hypothetical protein